MDKQETDFVVSLKPIKPPANISEIVSKFAKVCKLRSIGVFNNAYENPNPSNELQQRDGCDNVPSLTEEDSAMRIDRQPREMQGQGNECGDMEILKLFDTLLALKLAYVKLQEAHIPYDAEKIVAADEKMVALLDSLCKIRKVYKEKLVKKVDFVSACSALLLAEIQVQERALEKLKSQSRNKEKELSNLKQELHELETRNKKLAEEIKEREKESIKGLNHYPFEDLVAAVGKAIHDFAKPLIALMKVSGWDLDQAANAIQESVIYAKRSHKKYAFEAYIARRMFHGFSPQQCIMENVMKLNDPIDALIEDPQSSFAKFCRTKYLLVVHSRMEASFFGNLDHRTLVANGIHPHTPFYRAFIKMARWVWFLQGFIAFIEPKCEIFGVKHGSEFSDVYMEVLNELRQYKEEHDRYKVEFMIMPGFKRGESVIKSRVYVSKVGLSNGTLECADLGTDRENC